MSVRISRILHAGYVFECDGVQILFDPIFENPFSCNCYAFPDVIFDQVKIQDLKPDAVFISHYHDDHCSMESLALLNKDTPIFMFCLYEEMFSLIKQLGFKSVHLVTLNEPIQIGSFRITPRKALDEDVDCLYQIRAAGLNILNVVDSWIGYSTLNILRNEAPWDMILWPFQTMLELSALAPSRAERASQELPEEWIEQLQKLKPRYVVPSSCQFQFESWSWLNKAFFPISYAQFEKQINENLPQSTVVRINPGASFDLDQTSCTPTKPLSWVKPVDDQNVDYQYDPDQVPQSMAQIAKLLGPVSTQQMDRVMKYCEGEISARFASLPKTAEAFFERPRIWRLSVYDGEGEIRSFVYRLDGNIMKPVNDDVGISWVTEIPAVKLFAALESGESLTSLYVRINDAFFSAEVEEELLEADIMADPLLRCLYDGAFASYQKAQLKRLL